MPGAPRACRQGPVVRPFACLFARPLRRTGALECLGTPVAPPAAARVPSPTGDDRDRRLHTQLLYVSRPVGPQTTTVTSSILLSARAHNARNDIGGVLLQGQGMYLQVLEGERMAVNRLYARIVADLRHQDVMLLHLQEVTQRRFAGWSMAHVDLRAADAMVQLQHPEFDPYAASGAHVLTMVDELLASGHPISQPAS